MGRHGIRANAVCPCVNYFFTKMFLQKLISDVIVHLCCPFSNNIPKYSGVIDTPMVEGAVGELSEGLRSVAETSSLGRMGNAAECAGIIAFLLSDKASYITGTSHVVDGGSSA